MDCKSNFQDALGYEGGVNPEDIGERLRALRRNAEISSTEMGRRLGVSHAAVQDWETGRSALTLQRLQAYVAALGADVLVEVVPQGDPRGEALVRLHRVWEALSPAERAALSAMLAVWEEQHHAAQAGPLQLIK